MTTRIADTMQATAIDRASNQLKRSGGIRINLKLPESKKQLSCRANTTNKPTHTNDTIHVYNAIKLTNYFTNLLQQQQQFLLQLKRTTTTVKTGETWRQTQLKQQIPQQDMKLLSDIPEQPEEQANIISDAEGRLQDDSSVSSTGHQNATEEIKFIRGQRESASRFKASLYYLNPLQKQQAASNGNHHMQLHLQPGQEASSEQSNNKADSSHCCFKVSLLTPPKHRTGDKINVLVRKLFSILFDLARSGGHVTLVLLLLTERLCLFCQRTVQIQYTD